MQAVVTIEYDTPGLDASSIHNQLSMALDRAQADGLPNIRVVGVTIIEEDETHEFGSEEHFDPNEPGIQPSFPETIAQEM